MRKFILIGGSLLLLLLILAAVLPFLIPASTYEAKITAAVQQATGRQLTIAGPVRLSLLSGFSLQAEKVSLANAPGAPEADMLTLARLEVGLKLLPLLSGEVEISKLVLTDPVIHLDIDKNGHGNWLFTPATAPANTAPTAKTRKSADRLQQLHLGTVKISNGTLTYADARSGKREALTKLDASLTLTSLDDPLTLTGSVLWHEQTTDLAVNLKKPVILTEIGSSPLTVKLTAPSLKASFMGDLTMRPLLQLTGSLDLSSSSLREAASWAGSPMKAGSEFGAASLQSKLELGPNMVNLTGLEFSLDQLKGSGELAIALGGKTPLIKGALDLGTLDLNPYLAKPGNSNPAAAPVAAPAAASPAGSGWSETPIDLTALRSVDLQLGLSFTSLKFEKIEIGKSVVVLALQNGKLTVVFKQMALYGGSGTGDIVLDGSGQVAGVNTNLTLTDIAIQPALTALLGIDKLSGTANLKLTTTATGHSQHDLIATLGGSGGLNVANGAIKGVDFAALAQEVQALTGKGGTTATSGETAFSSLTSSFTIAGGILSNNDLAVTSPVVRLTGKGTANLLARTLDYRVEPNLAGNLQNGKTGIMGTTVPILIEGPWSSLSYRPDVQAVLTQKLQEKLPGAVQGLLGKNSGKAGDVLKGLFGK